MSHSQSLRGDVRLRRRHCFVSLSSWVRNREGQGNIVSLFFVTFLGAERKRGRVLLPGWVLVSRNPLSLADGPSVFQREQPGLHVAPSSGNRGQ